MYQRTEQQQKIKGSADIWKAVFIMNDKYIPQQEDTVIINNPLSEMRTPASLGGYMLVQEGNVPKSGQGVKIWLLIKAAQKLRGL